MNRKPSTANDVIRIAASIKREDIVYVDGIIESYDDLAVMRTIDANNGIVEFLVSPYFIDEMNSLLKALQREIDLRMIDSIP